MADKPGSQKIIAIDILRCVAAISVFWYHNQLGGVLAKYTGLSLFKLTYALGAIYAVPLFFLISGYCIHASNIKYIKANRSLPLIEYYKRRFLRIYPPYFVALLFNVLIWTAPMLFLLSREDWLRKRKNLWVIKIATAIGLSSYSLYLMHEPLIALKNFTVHKYFPNKFQPAGVLTGIFIIPVMTWFSYYYIEKPFISKKLSRSLKNE